MRRPATLVCLTLAIAALLAACGGKKQAAPSTAPPTPPATTATTPHPTLTSASDLAECLELTRNLRIISTLINASVQNLTNSINPEQLAKRVGNTQSNLVYSAKVIALLDVPPSLAQARTQLVASIRRFAADYGKARKAVVAGDMAGATRLLTDRAALNQMGATTAKINRACGNA